MPTAAVSTARVAAYQVLLLAFGGLLSPVLCAQLGHERVLLDVPAVKQPYNLCLAASVSMVLKYYGADIAPQAIADQIPIYKDGTTGRDLQQLVERIGFQGFLIQPHFDDLLGHLRKARPLVVSFPARGGSRHAMVLAGFDAGKQVLFLIDPASGKRKSQDYKDFQRKWEAAQRWTFLIVPQ